MLNSITGWMTRQQVFATFDITALRTWSKPEWFVNFM
jgi:hypothetical protein